MARRIIIFGATGHTGRKVAERLSAQGAEPVLAGRSQAAVRELGLVNKRLTRGKRARRTMASWRLR